MLANNVIRIPTSIDGNFFKYWFELLRPFHHLTDREIDVIVEFVKERYTLSKAIIDEGVLDKILLSDDTKKKIKAKCKMSSQHFQVIMSELKKKKVIVDNRINPKFIPNIIEGKDNFQLLFLLELK